MGKKPGKRGKPRTAPEALRRLSESTRVAASRLRDFRDAAFFKIVQNYVEAGMPYGANAEGLRRWQAEQ